MKKKVAQAILKSNLGLSLIEILIALTLLSLAGGFIVSNLAERLTEGEIKAAQIQINSLASAVKEFRRHCSFYPTTEMGLQALVEKPSGKDCKRYSPSGYLQDGADVPLDPWGMEFIYQSDGRQFDIISYGADQLEGGEGNDSDISYRGMRTRSK